MLASADKGIRACGPAWNAVCCVIVLDIRRYACVLCLADDAPDRSASLSEFFTEDKRRLARQPRKMGCRPSTRITMPGVVLTREKPCMPLSTDASVFIYSSEKDIFRVFLKLCLKPGCLCDINISVLTLLSAFLCVLHTLSANFPYLS